MHRSARAMVVAALAAVMITLGGCGGGAVEEQAEESPSRRDLPFDLNGCLGADQAELGWYEEGNLLAATGVLGEGDAGVIVSYEQAGTVCPWIPVAEALADAGITVMLYERVEELAPSEYLPGLIALLRERGVDKVGLLGGSIGGMGSITVAAAGDPPVDVVVSVSGADSGTIRAAADLTVPLLQVVARDDEPFATAARTTDQAADRSPRHRLVVVDGRGHASTLLSTDASLTPRIVAFLTSSLT